MGIQSSVDFLNDDDVNLIYPVGKHVVIKNLENNKMTHIQKGFDDVKGIILKIMGLR